MVLVLGRSAFCPKDRRQGYHELAMSLVGPTQPRQSSDFVSAMRGITAAPTHCRRGGS